MGVLAGGYPHKLSGHEDGVHGQRRSVSYAKRYVDISPQDHVKQMHGAYFYTQERGLHDQVFNHDVKSIIRSQ
jgi:hypothetical protein